MMKTIASLPIGYKSKTTVIKMLGLSKATHGWVARGIERTRAEKNFGAVLESIGATWARRANRGLKAAMIGGTLHLKVITLQRQVNIIQTMLWRSEEMQEKQRRILTWKNNAGGIVAVVRRRLKNMGWEEQKRR